MMEEEFQAPQVRIPDQIIDLGVQVTQQSLHQALAPLAPIWKMAAQIVNAKSPQQPVDPAVQKTFEAAMAEIQRKTQDDAARAKRSDQELMMKQQEMGFNQQQIVQQMQQEFAKQQAEMQNEIRMFAQSMQQANAQLQATIEKNNNDFMVKMLTLEKDNEKLRMEAEEKERQFAAKMQETLEANKVDFTPQVKQMGDLLGQIKESKSNDSLDAVLQGMNVIMQQLSAPADIQLVKDSEGKTVGARKTVHLQGQ